MDEGARAVTKIGIAIQQMSRENGGVFEAAKLSCQALSQAQELEIHIFAARDVYVTEDTENLPYSRLHLSSAYGTKRFGFAPAMLRQMLQVNPDLMIVHGVWTSHSLAAYIWSRLTGRPYIIVPHGMLEPWIMERSKRMKSMVWSAFTRDMLERAGAIQVLTPAELETVSHLVPSANSIVIPNFVRAGETDLTVPKWFRSSYQAKTVFLFFGRIHEKKGVLELCRAWEALSDNNRSFGTNSQLIFCGWIDGLEEFESIVASLSRRFNNIAFEGPQYGVEKWRSLAAADFLLLPSKSEGLPMSILEGWSVGLPTIMTEECNLTQAFADGAAIRTGGDEASIAEALLQAGSLDVEGRALMKAAAKGFVERNFSEEAVRDTTVQLIKQLTSHV